MGPHGLVMAPTKRKKGAIGAVYSDSDEEIEIDLSATVNTQNGSARVSHKRFVSESLRPAPTLPSPIPPVAVTMPSSSDPVNTHHSSSTVLMHAEKAKRKQVRLPCVNYFTQI